MTMATKTAKQEALALLALDTIEGNDRLWLNAITAKQAGYRVLDTPDGLRIREPEAFGYDENGSGMHVYPLSNVPDYTLSVDACLTLPLPEGMELRMTFGGRCGAGYYDLGLQAEVSGFHGHTLPIAILKLFWNWQRE